MTALTETGKRRRDRQHHAAADGGRRIRRRSSRSRRRRTPSPSTRAAALAIACDDLRPDLVWRRRRNCTVERQQRRHLGIDGNGADVTLPSVTIAGGLHARHRRQQHPAQTININSLTGTATSKSNANTHRQPSNESVVLKVAGQEPPTATEMAVPFDLSQMTWKQNAACQQLRRVGAADRVRRPGDDQHEGRQQPVGRDDLRAERELHAQGTQDLFGSVLARTIDNARQRQHPLRPPPRDRLLGRRPPHGRHLHLEALLEPLAAQDWRQAAAEACATIVAVESRSRPCPQTSRLSPSSPRTTKPTSSNTSSATSSIRASRSISSTTAPLTARWRPSSRTSAAVSWPSNVLPAQPQMPSRRARTGSTGSGFFAGRPSSPPSSTRAWFIHHDADEFRESPWSHLSLSDAIRHVDALGFNAIDFAGLDFWPVHDRFRAGDDVRDAFTFYSELAPHDRLQVRCWKKTDSLDLASSGGHEARFTGPAGLPAALHPPPLSDSRTGARRAQGLPGAAEQVSRSRSAPGAGTCSTTRCRRARPFIRDPATLTRYDPDALRRSLTLHPRYPEELEEALREARSEVSRADRRSPRPTRFAGKTRRRLRTSSTSPLSLGRFARNCASVKRRPRCSRGDLEQRTAELADGAMRRARCADAEIARVESGSRAARRGYRAMAGRGGRPDAPPRRAPALAQLAVDRAGSRGVSCLQGTMNPEVYLVLLEFGQEHEQRGARASASRRSGVSSPTRTFAPLSLTTLDGEDARHVDRPRNRSRERRQHAARVLRVGPRHGLAGAAVSRPHPARSPSWRTIPSRGRTSTAACATCQPIASRPRRAARWSAGSTSIRAMFELFGLTVRQWVDTSLVIAEWRTLASLLPLAQPLDDQVFGDDWRTLFREPSPLSENYRALPQDVFLRRARRRRIRARAGTRSSRSPSTTSRRSS